MNTQVLSQNLISLPQIGLRKCWIFGFILIAFLLIFYIFQISAITKASFLIAGYEQEIIKLSQGNENLKIGFSQENSLANLENILNKLNYEKIKEIYYLRVLEGQVMAK